MQGIIKREFWFSSAHRIEGHPKCGRMHGHNYRVTVTLQGAINNDTGMVIDFGLVDEMVKPIIDAMDHRYIVSNGNLNAKDPYADVAMELGDDFQMPFPQSTAEFMAAFLHDRICNKLHWTRDLCQVDVQETPRNEATYVYGG